MRDVAAVVRFTQTVTVETTARVEIPDCGPSERESYVRALISSGDYKILDERETASDPSHATISQIEILGAPEKGV